jgi:hypothetical protein
MGRYSKNTYLVTSAEPVINPLYDMEPEDVGDKKEQPEEQTPANLLDEFLEPFLVEKIGKGHKIEYQKGGANWRREAGGGQIKLYFTDIQTIDTFQRRLGALPQYIIVAGAAPGTHYLDLVMLFPPSIQWHFYDTGEFHQDFYKEMVSMPNVVLYNKYYTTEDCIKWAGFRSTLLLSDIRTTTHHRLVRKIERLEFLLQQAGAPSRKKKTWEREKQKTKFEVEQLISNDMLLQQQMAVETGAVLSSLKYRLPWPSVDSRISEDYMGLQGYLLEQIENRPNSTEGRLLVFCENADEIYDGLQHPAGLDAKTQDIYIPFSAEYMPDVTKDDKHSTTSVMLQIRADPARQKATFKPKTYKILEYEQLFAHINRNIRPGWDKRASKTVLDTLRRILGVQLDEKAIVELQHFHQEPPSLPDTQRSAQWVSTGYNQAVETWKFHVTEDKNRELSERSGCSAEEPLQTEIRGLKEAQEQFSTEDTYLTTIASLFTKFWPFEHQRAHLDLALCV